MEKIKCNSITHENIHDILTKVQKMLESTNVFKVNTLYPLGSTRLMLKNKGKSESKDVDLAIQLIEKYESVTLDEAINKLTETLEKHNFKFRFINNRKIIFNNVLSLYLFDNNKTYQIDLMLSEPIDTSYHYLTELRFFNDETEEGLKGLHRTELIRSMIKAKGLSLGTSHINRFVKKEKIKETQNVLDAINIKIKRARKEKIKQAWEKTYDKLEELQTDLIEELFEIKTDLETGKDVYYLKTRYSIANSLVERMFVDIICDKVSYTINDGMSPKIPYWKDIFAKEYSLNSEYIHLNKVEHVLIFMTQQHNKKENYWILKDYIAELKRKTTGNYYNKQIKTLINKHL